MGNATDTGLLLSPAQAQKTKTALLLYSVFHINLAFSSIPKSHYSLILDRCYWPLLDIAIRMAIPFGFEASGYSLEQLEKTDASFIKALKTAWQQEQIEFVGAGYTQSILPLCPARVNRENLRIGHDVYQSLLGQKPVTAYINEQTYASGLVDLFLDAGYRQLFMEYNNPARFHAYPTETRYQPQQILNPDGSRSITVLWNDSIAFQKLQRLMHEEISQDDYLAYLSGHGKPGENRGIAFYGSDAEVIDYHPGRLDAAYHPPKDAPDLQRLVAVLDVIQHDDRYSWATPKAFAQTVDPTVKPIRLESPEYPLPCKKQAKYNPTRWAVSGRDDAMLNTSCYRRFYDMVALESLTRKPLDDALWRKLLEKWGSDFRTHTTDEKTQLLRQTAASLEEKIAAQFPVKQTDAMAMMFWNPNASAYDGFVCVEVQFPHGVLHGYPGLAAHVALQAFQIEEMDRYQDGSVRWVKALLQVALPAQAETILTWECGEKPSQAQSKVTMTQTPFDATIQTEAVTLKLIPKRGGAIASLQFNHLDTKPWVGTIAHGAFDDIHLGADFYSGHFILAAKDGDKATDLVPGQLQLPENLDAYPIRVPVRIGVNTPMGSLWKTLYIYRHEPRLDLLYHFRFQDIAPSSCRVGMMTVLPDAFDHDTLAYTTVNGGVMPERFLLKGHHVTHDEPVSVTVSAQHGLGATEGWVAIEDKDKRMVLRTYPQAAYAMPMVHYEETTPGYFLRLLPSIGELDDTSHTLRRGHHQVMFTWEGQHAAEPMAVFQPPVSLSANVTILPI